MMLQKMKIAQHKEMLENFTQNATLHLMKTPGSNIFEQALHDIVAKGSKQNDLLQDKVIHGNDLSS